MDGMQQRRDLADLPEPRFLYVTPAWRRRRIVALAAILAAAGAGLLYAGVAGPGIAWGHAGLGAAALAAGGAALVLVVVADWRDWIDFAAAADGVYLAGRGMKMVFVPWSQVTGISVLRSAAMFGETSRLKLTLRLPGEGWKQLSPLNRIVGDGEVRSFVSSTLAASGEELAAGIQSVRDRLAPHLPLKAKG